MEKLTGSRKMACFKDPDEMLHFKHIGKAETDNYPLLYIVYSKNLVCLKKRGFRVQVMKNTHTLLIFYVLNFIRIYGKADKPNDVCLIHSRWLP
jgi:hypothetical protein